MPVFGYANIKKLEDENLEFLSKVLDELDISPAAGAEESLLKDYIELCCYNGYIASELKDILHNKLDNNPFKYITDKQFRHLCEKKYGLTWEKEVKYRVCY